jgi:hypothetical protein
MTKIRTQISVHMENRPGALAELTAILTDAGTNILAVSVPDSGEYGTVRILPDDVMVARDALQDAELPHAAADVLEVVLPHETGALAKMSRLLDEAQVVVRYAYCTISEGMESATCILQVDDIHKAETVLNQKLG